MFYPKISTIYFFKIVIYLYLSLFIYYMKTNNKNIKISEKHHVMLKTYCDDNGLKIYKVIEKWINQHCSPKKKDIYGE